MENEIESQKVVADMRVLIVHNHYRSLMPSGENNAVNNQVSSLRNAGLEVRTFFRDSDVIAGFGLLQKAALASSPTYSREAARDFRHILRNTRPDIVHLHNPYPLISPWIIRIANESGVPVVQTVHNYRHSCLGSMGFTRNAEHCEACVGKSFPWPGAVHGCYHHSRTESFSLAVALRLHRPTFQLVDRFIAVSPLIEDSIIRTGISPEKVTVLPNSVPRRGALMPPGKGFLFIGRLTPEKGIALLMSAWEKFAMRGKEQLVVVGDGPERERVRAANKSNVRYEGLVDHERVGQLLNEAAIVIVPSMWSEGFPLVVAEAFERGRPIISTRGGPLSNLITPAIGWVADANPDAFAEIMSTASADSMLTEKSIAARTWYDTQLSPEVNLERLLDVYRDARGTADDGPSPQTPQVP
jgi:glycosyltransferase involved in cell wall biosynthesis